MSADDLFATPPGSAGPPPPYPNQNVLDASVTLAQRVAGLHIPDADPKKQLLQHPGRWVTFNDFTVEECPEAQVRNLYADQKVPCILVYSQVPSCLLCRPCTEQQQTVFRGPKHKG